MSNGDKVIKILDLPTYKNTNGINQLCRDVVGRGTFGHIAVGHNIMKANASNGMNRHDQWNQTFIVTRGEGTIILDGERRRITAPCAIKVPAGTEHDMVTGENEEVEYIYINDYLEND